MDSLCAGRPLGGYSEKKRGINTCEMPVDSEARITQQIKLISNSVEGLSKVFGQQLEQMQKEIFARLDSAALEKKAPQPVVESSPFQQAPDQPAALNAQMKRLEDSIKALLGTKATLQDTSLADQEGKNDRKLDAVGGQSESLQTNLVIELKTHTDALALFKSQQDQFLREFQESAQMPSLPPSSEDVDQTDASQIQVAVSDIDPDLANGVTAGAAEPTQAEKDLEASLEVYEQEEEEDEEEAREALMLREGNGLGSVFSADNELETPAYHVEDFYWKTGINQKIARSDKFANFTVGVVIFNAVYIGFDSDYNNASNIYKADLPFLICSQFFCVYFTWELLCRFLAFEHKGSCMKDGWFKFDAFLVSTMILDTWILMPTLFFLGGGVTIPTQPLRMLRLFKLTRMARLMKAFPELVTMIKGLVRSLRAISSSMILVGLMVYVWAIMMHMLMKEEVEFNETLWTDYQLSFATMTDCVWTLLVSGTLMLDNASPLMSHLLFSKQFHYILAGMAFVSYAMMSAMCILQMLIGVLCDVVSTVKMEETSANAIGLMKQEILGHLQACDSSGDGKISQAELAKVMKAKRSRSLLRRLRINYPFFLELQKGAYAKPDMAVPIKDVLELMVMSRGDNVATVESMAGALVTIINEIAILKGVIESDLSKFESRMSSQMTQSITVRNGRFSR